MNAQLMICTVVSRNGREIQDDREMEQYSESLCQIMGEKLRRGDVYAVYRPGCVLVLLNYVEKRFLDRVKERIRSGFREKCGGKATLRMETVKVTECGKG